ncbi:hypothetical protein V1508DRAFT_366987 [Lipomyces doorenjongii]|uniref:uncharacterized protein n=1 Tax=Lipomyces doorenjongii TaxID=383834 RepID=UPI0034CD270A
MTTADTASTKTTRPANTPLSDDETVEAGIRILRDMLAVVRAYHPDNSDERDTCFLEKAQSEDSYTDDKKISFAPDCTDCRCPSTLAVKKLMHKMRRRNDDGDELDVLSATSTNTTSMTGVTLTNSIVEKMKTLRIRQNKEDMEKQSSKLDKPTSECNRLTFAQRLRALVPKTPRHEVNEKSEDADQPRHTIRCKKHFHKQALIATLHRKAKTCVDKVNALRARGGAAVLAMTSTLSGTALTGNLTQKMDEVKVKVEPDAPVFANAFTTPAPAPVQPLAGPARWPYPSAAAFTLAKQHLPTRLSAEPQGAQDVSIVKNTPLNSPDILSDKMDYNHVDDDGGQGLELELSQVDKAAEEVSDDDIDVDDIEKFFEEQEEIGLSYLNFDEQLTAMTASPSPSTQEVPIAAKELAANLEWASLRPVSPEAVTATATNRYTTQFAQQVLTHHGFQGPLDSVAALNVFHNLMRSGGPPVSLSATSATAVTADEVTTTAPLVTIAAGKPGVIHMPTCAVSATAVATSSSAFVLHERPPSPPLEPVNPHESDVIADFGLAGPSTATARISGLRAPSVPDSVDPLVRRFMAIGGIERLFPGLATDWRFSGSIPELSTNFDHQMTDSVQGISYIPTSPDDPMSIARLTNPNPGESAASSSYTATTGSSSAGSTPTSLSSGSNGYGTNGNGRSSINSLLLGAAAFPSGYPGDLGHYRRSSTTSTGSHSREAEDEDEDGNNSTSSNSDHGPNYTTTSNLSNASGPLPRWHGPVSVPPSPNYNTHPSLQNLTHQQQPPLPRVAGPQRVRSRKQQCPECNGWYSNLSAHCSTHLSYASRPHSCTVCGRGFSRPNDLLRHQKSHQGDAPFCCPYHAVDRRCHPSGGFSRCDTYKNHLKSMHFDYPVGTKKKDRQGAGGKCRACLMEFENVDEWISAHVESGRCKVLQ